MAGGASVLGARELDETGAAAHKLALAMLAAASRIDGRGAAPVRRAPGLELAALVANAEFAEIEVEPLGDAVLWGQEPERERSALHAHTPPPG